MGDAAQDDTQVALDSLWFQGAAVTGYNLGGLAYGRPGLFAGHLRQALGHAAAGRFSVRPEVVAPDRIAEVHARLESRTSSGKFVLAW
jgi:NADPH2:quinone reductase